MTGAAVTHIGQVRKTNQDRVLFSPSVGAVADGMGGHQGGEQAAAITIEILAGLSGQVSKDRFVDTVVAANRAVFEESERPELRGMGTTVVAAALHSEDATITVINVGDSRCYLLRRGELRQITVDHSLVEELVRQGRITEEDARSHPQRNIVTRALGLSDEVEIDVFELDAGHGDRLLLCSDGLFNEVEIDAIAAPLREIDDADLAARSLIDLAVAGGGRDNISVVVLDIVDDGHAEFIREQAESARRPTPKAAAAVFDEVESTSDETPADEPGPDGEGIDQVSVDPRPTDRLPVTDAEEVGDLVDVPESSRGHQPSASSDSRSGGLADDDRLMSEDRGRARWVAMAVIMTFLVAFLGINWFGSSAYFAAEQSGEVVIFRGRPGGILWVDPELEQPTGVAIEDLAPAGVLKLEEELEWTSLEAAIEFVDQLERADPDEAES